MQEGGRRLPGEGTGENSHITVATGESATRSFLKNAQPLLHTSCICEPPRVYLTHDDSPYMDGSYVFAKRINEKLPPSWVKRYLINYFIFWPPAIHNHCWTLHLKIPDDPIARCSFSAISDGEVDFRLRSPGAPDSETKDWACVWSLPEKNRNSEICKDQSDFRSLSWVPEQIPRIFIEMLVTETHTSKQTKQSAWKSTPRKRIFPEKGNKRKCCKRTQIRNRLFLEANPQCKKFQAEGNSTSWKDGPNASN